MAVVLGGLTPHPTSLIPEIGNESLTRLGQTVQAVKALARRVAAESPDVVVIATPHGPRQDERFGLFGRDWHLGDFAAKKASNVTLDAPGDPTLAMQIARECARLGLPVDFVDREHAVPLDYGLSVPLYYLQHAGYQGAIMPVVTSSLGRESHRLFGKAIAQAAGRLGKRTVLLASGDLSHHESAPEKVAKKARRFDQLLIKLLADGSWDRIFELDAAMVEEAGECGFETILVLLGALEKSLPQAELLAYEDPTGVGYATLTIDVQDAEEQDEEFNPAGFARQVADTFLQTDHLPPHAPAHFPKQAQGCFVCLHRGDALEACAGALTPKEGNLASCIARYTLEALHDYAETTDGRHALTIDELNHLSLTVYMTGPLEAVEGLEGFQAGKHGLVVTRGDDYGVALPEPGFDRPEQMLEIALERAGLTGTDDYKLERFTAEAHPEKGHPAW
ncbi:MAG: AmmeMemoRadiSam system protein B [Candidatus Sericytochromatia bacterium]